MNPPASLESRNYLVSLDGAFGVLNHRMTEYLERQARQRGLNGTVREYVAACLSHNEPAKIVLAILDYIFEAYVALESSDLFLHTVPYLRACSITGDEAGRIILDTMNYLMQSLGALFPGMVFGDGIRIGYDIVTGNNLMITTARDFSVS